MSRQRIEIEPMKKKNMIRLVLAVLLVSVSLAEAQQPKKVSRIGYFSAFNPTLESLRSDAIRYALRELGYIDGQNIVIEYRYMQGKLDRAPELIADLVGLKVDLIIVAGGSGPILAARMQPRRFQSLWRLSAGDPVELGLVESLAVPGATSPASQPFRETRWKAARDPRRYCSQT